MFISRKTYDDLREDLLNLRAQLQAISVTNATLHTHIEWLQAQITKSELERAGLIKRYLQVDVPVPSFERSETDRPDPNQVIDFKDVGDEEAAKMGIEWNTDGTLLYAKK